MINIFVTMLYVFCVLKLSFKLSGKKVIFLQIRRNMPIQFNISKISINNIILIQIRKYGGY